MKDYTHELNKEIRSISGGYELEKEARIEMDGREVLVAVGNGVVDSSCCGVWGCRFALVPGYVIDWKSRAGPEGLPVSRVEPIQDDKTKEKMSKLLEVKECVSQVIFW